MYASGALWRVQTYRMYALTYLRRQSNEDLLWDELKDGLDRMISFFSKYFNDSRIVQRDMQVCLDILVPECIERMKTWCIHSIVAIF